MSRTEGARAVPDRTVRHGGSGWLRTVVGALLFGACHLITGYTMLTAYVVEPDGPWDHQAVTNAQIAAGTALALCAMVALAGWLYVRTPWLRVWALVPPATLAVAALLRLTVLAPAL